MQNRPLRKSNRASKYCESIEDKSVVSSEVQRLEAIRASHQRCDDMGVSPICAPEDLLIRADLAVARERNRNISKHSVPVMEMMLEHVLVTQSMVVLTDVQGTVLHSVGPEDFLTRACKVALTPGVNWSEQNKGTNAIGTSLVTEAPTLVHADEHFMHANHFLTCSAAPIFDPRGSVVGVLDVTGDHHAFNPHTMGLVNMSARMIQNHWLVEEAQQALRLHFHARPAYLGTLMECIVVAGQDGRLLGANREALDQLGMSGAALRMNTLNGLFGLTVSSLVDHFARSLAQPLALRLPDGRQVYARACFNWPSWQRLGSAAESAGAAPLVQPPPAEATAPAAPSTQPARQTGSSGTPALLSLRQLQTGDTQMDAAVERVKRVLDRDIAILIQGETGSGKDVFARAIHQAAKRAKGPFVVVNCASIPEGQIEVELFGCVKGALAGARGKGSTGKLLQAHGGTLFLDEIGDMPLAQQARLLRVLQEREVTPLGGSRATSVDVAIISATHRPLHEMIAANTFREDLYYRLNGLVIRLPALRERSDLMALTEQLLQSESGGRPLKLADDVMSLLQAHRWPGNVRQLATVLRTAAALADRKTVIQLEHLSDDFLLDALPPCDELTVAALHGRSVDTCDEAVSATSPSRKRPPAKEVDVETVRLTVLDAEGNVSLAARQLGVCRNTIYRKLFWDKGQGR